MIDLHAHILPDVDDGPRNAATALEMARLATDDGIVTVACTCHRLAELPTRPELIRDRIAELQPQIDAAGIALRLVPGLEIALDQAGAMDDEELRGASLGGTGRWLLLEMPFHGWPLELPELMTALEVRGFNVVLAHPERNPSVQASPDRMRDPVGRGALVQVTAGSLTGELGPAAQRAALALLRAGVVHIIASDMHSPTRRPPGLRDGLSAAAAALRVDADEILWMVTDVPQAVIDGRDVRPPRLGKPPPSRRRPPGEQRGPDGPRPRRRT